MYPAWIGGKKSQDWLNLDVDWFFRRAAYGVKRFATGPLVGWNQGIARRWADIRLHNPMTRPSVAAFIRRVQYRPLETSVFVVITLLFFFLAFGLIA